jgi:hypothetical protein
LTTFVVACRIAGACAVAARDDPGVIALARLGNRHAERFRDPFTPVANDPG